MKLDIDEVAFVKSALEGCSIKVSDAKAVGAIMDKLQKEFDRLFKLQDKA
tara:strand:+ start:178 stop:327 length:150 start_codon:yes stop_codon:yes gene_type:complete